MTADGRYIVMAASDGTVYFYDKRYSAWYERRLDNVCSAHEINGILYAVTKDGNGKMNLVRLVGTEDDFKMQSENSFEAVSGNIGRGKVYGIYKKLRAYMLHGGNVGKATEISIYVSSDRGEWKKAFVSDGTETDSEKIITAPMIPLRCRTLKIKISGKVSNETYLLLYGIYLDSEKGSEIGG